MRANIHKGYVRAAIEWALETREAHERPVAVRGGHTRLRLFAGPAPREWAPGDELTAAGLVQLRRDADLTQTELAEALGVDRVNISNWESGERPIPVGRRAQIRNALARSRPKSSGAPAPSGAELRALRQELGLTQAALAHALGFKWQSRIARWETGRDRIPADVLERARELGSRIS
jgi:transcriptional regulator with XRE-family HTH domain